MIAICDEEVIGFMLVMAVRVGDRWCGRNLAGKTAVAAANGGGGEQGRKIKMGARVFIKRKWGVCVCVL